MEINSYLFHGDKSISKTVNGHMKIVSVHCADHFQHVSYLAKMNRFETPMALASSSAIVAEYRQR